jgi:hypothetical protein
VSVPKVVDGIERVLRRGRLPEYHCGAIYSKTGCPKCGRKLIMWSSSKKGDFWKCGCGWESR